MIVFRNKKEEEEGGEIFTVFLCRWQLKILKSAIEDGEFFHDTTPGNIIDGIIENFIEDLTKEYGREYGREYEISLLDKGN